MNKKIVILLLAILFSSIMAFGMIACSNNAGSESGEVQEQKGLSFNNITLEGNNGFLSVSNATEKFSFVDEVIVTGNTKFIVSFDEFGFATSLTKVVPLSVGNNTVYIFEMLVFRMFHTRILILLLFPLSFVLCNQILFLLSLDLII